MKLIADENVDGHVIERLRAEGHDIIAIVKQYPSIPDHDVLVISNEERALLITEDKDFGELVFHKKRSHFGILLVRLEGVPRPERIQLVCDTIQKRGPELANAFSVLTASSLRIRASE